MKIISSDLLEYLKDREIEGHIHSVFKNVVNIQTEDDRLIAIIDNKKDIAPMSITSGETIYSNLSLAKGERVWITGNQFTIPGRKITLNMNMSLVWNSEPEKVSMSNRSCDINRALAILEDVITTHGRNTGLVPLMFNINDQFPTIRPYTNETMKMNRYSKKIKSRFCQFIKSVYTLNLSEINRHSNNIIGFGPGLTPSADDLLAGMMISNIYMAEYYDLNSGYVRSINREIIRGIKDKTTDISYEMLRNASGGKGSDKVKQLIRAILIGEVNLKEKIISVIDHGGESGSDMLTGIYLGMRIINDEALRRKLQK